MALLRGVWGWGRSYLGSPQVSERPPGLSNGADQSTRAVLVAGPLGPLQALAGEQVGDGIEAFQAVGDGAEIGDFLTFADLGGERSRG